MTPDERYMRRAITLARRGFPAPNPHVGCVLVRDGEIVGEGYHHHAGAPHAEAAALAVAGDRAAGADAYVTLEPCNHFGRTPPCSEALIRARVRRVVVACADPNPKAAGGLSRLNEVGIETSVGLLADEAYEANIAFMTAMRLKRPYVVVKAGASLDGRIALPSGESKWITGPEARRVGRRLRAELGAVLVGRRTVELDDPELTARTPGAVNPPLRIVLDPHSKLSGREKVFDDQAPTRHVTGEIDLPGLLSDLFEGGVTSLLVEGGATTVAGFVRAGLVDAVELFVAGKLLGAGPTWLADIGLSSLADAPELNILKVTRIGSDVRISARLNRNS